jgi:hypothetical protein
MKIIGNLILQEAAALTVLDSIPTWKLTHFDSKFVFCELIILVLINILYFLI